jgi:hypothetical protein
VPVHNLGEGGARHDAVQAIARRLLDERLDELTSRALAKLEAEEAAYASKDWDPVQKREGMRRTLELALTRLAGGPVPAAVSRATEDVGRERAEQAFPLTALMHSFQLDLRTLWEAVLEEGRTRGISADPDFLDGLIRVWEATDANSVEVVDAYRRTERDLASRRTEVRNRAFSRLVLEGEQDPSTVAEASTLLGFSEHVPLTVVVVESVPTGDPALSQVDDALRRGGLLRHFGWMGDELLGIVRHGRSDREAVLAVLQPFAPWRCGVAEVPGLALTARGIRFARAAIRSSTRPGVRHVEGHWVGAIMSAQEELPGAMATGVLRPLLGLRDSDSVIETLRCYFDLGSVAEVAARTYRHRNTVGNRLQAAEEATGLKLSRPADAARLVLALAWLETDAGARFQATVS